ncbi:KAT8 regulatory NSL complex subunit 1-like isoform X1 [Anolis sagrei]|uniref:KAT8 regulatory NSL complex subunit 1-like isoform X1 n=1 Tax=Anolis sagrei TaxID=38937 RepID=UPI00351FC0C8
MASSPPPPPEEEEKAEARQAALWGRARSLCRRLRALQARQVERHVRHQLAGLAAAAPPVSPATLGPELRRLAASATARLRAAQLGCDSDATASSSSVSSSSSSSSSSSCCSSSSSSDSEDPEAPPPPPPPDPRRRLAERQWAVERAAIICRWTWLQAQVTDLEYRIRQQTDVYKQLRANKGPVVLGDLQPGGVMKQPGPLGSARKNKVLSSSSSSPSSSSCLPKVPPGDRPSPCIPSYLLQNAEKQNSRLAQSFRNLVCQNPTCAPINGSPEPPKACTSPHQVNGISNCFNTGSSLNPQDGVSPGRVLKKPKPPSNCLPAPPATLDPSCVAARIRPICRYRKRRLVRVSAVSHLSRKPQKPLSLKCGCEGPKSCILCGCKASIQTVDPETMSLEERVALLDSGFHPILSFSHGNPLHLHFEALLREGHQLSHKIKTLKAPNCGLKDLTNNICSSSLSPSGSLLKGPGSRSWFATGLPQAHRSSSLHHASPLSLEGVPSPASNQVAGNSVAAGSSALQPAKKKKVECSYDINNIVIPMSMAAATRVEKLQYKEILTPRWRMVNLEELKSSEEVDSEVEDTSDEAYLNRHQKFEELERVRWDSWAGSLSHRRANRSTSRADGRWIPQPGSPDASAYNLNHVPCASSPSGTLSPELCGALSPLLLKGRSRGSLSVSEDAALSVFDVDDNIQFEQPWEMRTFPLSNTEHQALLRPSECLSKQTGPVQQRDPSGSQGHVRTNSITPSPSHPKEPFVSGWQEAFAGHRGTPPTLLNNR